MLEKNQLQIHPGPYQHYKTGKIYIVENVVTHTKIEGVWKPLPDPLVVYRNLEMAFDYVNGNKMMVVKNFARPLSEFNQDMDVNGVTVKRFKAV